MAFFSQPTTQAIYQLLKRAPCRLPDFLGGTGGRLFINLYLFISRKGPFWFKFEGGKKALLKDGVVNLLNKGRLNIKKGRLWNSLRRGQLINQKRAS